jgi:hypothetical protein
MNSETVSPMPPRRFKSARNGTSVTPAIGDSTSGGLIRTSRILKGFMRTVSRQSSVVSRSCPARGSPKMTTYVSPPQNN